MFSIAFKLPNTKYLILRNEIGGSEVARIGCPCGGTISNTSDGDEMEYYFMADEMLKENWRSRAFFDIQYSDLATEIWKCHICDRMLFFEDGASVTRYMKRIDATVLTDTELDRPHIEGICYNNLLFNEVDRHFTWKSERGDCPEYNFFGDQIDGPKLLTPEIMHEEVFSHKNGWFLNWWRARLYDDLLVLFSPFQEHGDAPVRVWKLYEQVWDK